MFSQLRGRLSSATLAVHETFTEMMALMESQLREMRSLRDQLAQSEQALRSAAPQVSNLIHEVAPSVRLPAAPNQPSAAPMNFQPISAPAPRPAMPEPIASVAPVATRLPSGPMMTQILWPSKAPAATEPMPSIAKEAPPAPAPMTRPTAAEAPKPTTFLEAPLASAQHNPGPNLEQATLEELNAALAYAFAQVSSNTVPMEKGSITQMMPPPMPTSALRYGHLPEMVERH